MPRKRNLTICIKKGGFACPYCEYKVLNTLAMKLHIKVSHKEKGKLDESTIDLWPVCMFCGKTRRRNKVCSCNRG